MTVAPILRAEQDFSVLPLYETIGRHPLNFYESPWWFTTELLRHVKPEGIIGEPCVGHGGISSLLKGWSDTKKIWTNDIDPNKRADYHYDATVAESWDKFEESDWIITNPPYGDKAAPIIKNAFKKARVGVGAFLLTSFLEPCDNRAAFLEEHPPSLILIMPRYCFRKDKKGKRWATDNITISCFVWDKRTTEQRIIIRKANKIAGFYKTPDKGISQDDALTIVQGIVSGEITTNYGRK